MLPRKEHIINSSLNFDLYPPPHKLITRLYSLEYVSECDINECWCISDGNYNCSIPVNGACYADQCHDKEDCPGNGYWCNDTGENFRIFFQLGFDFKHYSVERLSYFFDVVQLNFSANGIN